MTSSTSFLEGGIPLAHHAAVGFIALGRANDGPLGGVFGLGALAGQQGVVDEEGHGAARFHRTEGITVVFDADDMDTQLFFVIHLVEQLFRSGAGSDGHVLALEIVKIFDAGIFVHQKARAHNEECVGKIHLLLALAVVGGGAAFKVEGAVRSSGMRFCEVMGT